MVASGGRAGYDLGRGAVYLNDLFNARGAAIFLGVFRQYILEENVDKKTPKTPPNFDCEKCDLKCSKKSEWTRHILTRKHVNHDKC